MAEKRRDSKNRVLKTGESQRKDGRYMYKYTDVDGKVKYEYSWKLVPTDKMPAGKKDEPCLRDKIKEVEKRLESGLNKDGFEIDVLEMMDRTLKVWNLRGSTRNTYETARRRISEHPISTKKIARVKPSDCRGFLLDMKKTKVSCYTIRIACLLLKRTFEMAIEDDLIVSNPITLSCVNMTKTSAGKRDALTEEQMLSFLDVIRSDKVGNKSYDFIVLLFETGLRISEMIGLKVSDIDLTARKVSVKHQLSADKTTTETKTMAGVREIPLTDTACLSLKRVLRERSKKQVKPEYGEYLFIGKNGEPVMANCWQEKFRRLKKKWMEREPELATDVTPHVCRHTFCTRLVASGMSPKVVQYLMGHEDASVTMNVYTHTSYEQVEAEMRQKHMA